jgi:hypothetical protein
VKADVFAVDAQPGRKIESMQSGALCAASLFLTKSSRMRPSHRLVSARVFPACANLSVLPLQPHHLSYLCLAWRFAKFATLSQSLSLSLSRSLSLSLSLSQSQNLSLSLSQTEVGKVVNVRYKSPCSTCGRRCFFCSIERAEDLKRVLSKWRSDVAD